MLQDYIRDKIDKLSTLDGICIDLFTFLVKEPTIITYQCFKYFTFMRSIKSAEP